MAKIMQGTSRAVIHAPAAKFGHEDDEERDAGGDGSKAVDQHADLPCRAFDTYPVNDHAGLREGEGEEGSDGIERDESVGADLFLRIFPSSTTVHQGDLLTYTFPIWNLGPGVAEGEVLSNLQVPAGSTFDYLRISGTPGLGTCTHPPYGGIGQIICHKGDGMAPNTTWTVRLTVRVTAAAGSTITANAATMSDTPDPNMANNIATVSVKVQ